jgi:hypothetical protein
MERPIELHIRLVLVSEGNVIDHIKVTDFYNCNAANAEPCAFLFRSTMHVQLQLLDALANEEC